MTVKRRVQLSAMFGQPRGRVLSLRYTKQALPQDHAASAPDAIGGGATASAATGEDVLEVRYQTPMSEETAQIPNTEHSPDNPALMFLAAIGKQPTDFGDGTRLDVVDERIVAPLQYDRSEGMYGIHGAVLERGQAALIEASWNPWTEEMIGSNNGEKAPHAAHSDVDGDNGA